MAGLNSTHLASMNNLDHLVMLSGSSHAEVKQLLKTLAQLSLTLLGTWVRVVMCELRISVRGG